MGFRKYMDPNDASMLPLDPEYRRRLFCRCSGAGCDRCAGYGLHQKSPKPVRDDMPNRDGRVPKKSTERR